MSWHRKHTDRIADVLRFIAYAFLALNVILLTMFSFWFVRNFLGFFKNWITRMIFSQQW